MGVRTPPLASVGLGIGVGVFSGLFGVGGGVLAVPSLLWLGLGQHAAHATSLAALSLTAAAGAIPFAMAGVVAVGPSLALVAGTLIGVSVGAAAMHHLPERWLALAFAAVIIGVGVRLLLGVEPHALAPVPELDVPVIAGMVTVGLATGALSSVLGIGGGVVLVPALVLAFGFSQHAAEGTSLAVIIPTALLGALRHTSRGYTAWRTGLAVGLGGLLGAPVGAVAALALDGLFLQRLFAVLLVLLGGRSLWHLRGDRQREDLP